MTNSANNTAQLKAWKVELAKVKQDIADIEYDDKAWGLKYTQEIVDKLFSSYHKGKDWLDRVKEQAATRGWVISPIGRRRNLYRVFTGSRKFIADAGRRAQNSPIQGVASEVGATAGLLILRAADEYRRHMDWPVDEDFIDFCRVVHDACYFGVPFRYVIPMMHIIAHEATYGVTKYYEEVFGWKFNIEPEIEIDVGVTGDTSESWDWSFPHFFHVLTTAFTQGLRTGHFADMQEVEDAYAIIIEPWKDKASRQYLLERWPLLNRSDLSKEIFAAMKAYNVVDAVKAYEADLKKAEKAKSEAISKAKAA